jgi:hypothetical protein
MSLVIKKRVDLDFLGEEYKEAYLVFRSIPLEDYKDVIQDIKKLEEGDNSAYLDKVNEYLQKYFLSGEFPNDAGKLEPVIKEDLVGLDGGSTVTCFERMTGSSFDPKSKAPLTSISSTELDPQTQS